jgi:ribonuclease BN (tRNA processing enzyme)
MKITFLGTNGWYDSATGNTPSALIETNFYYIVLDAGFGMAKLSDHLTSDKPLFIFLSHFHIDHICGLHTLPKLGKRELTIVGQKGTKKYLKIFLNHPFTASLKEMGPKISIKELSAGNHKIPFEVKCLSLKHADPSMGYRFNIDGKVVVYCSDTAVCPNDEELARDADMLIHECAFMPGHTTSWGHTNPEQAGELAQTANVKHLVLTHLGADHYYNSEARKLAEVTAKEKFPNTTAAEDGMVIEL